MEKANNVISKSNSLRKMLRELEEDLKCLLSEDQNGIIFLERILDKVVGAQKAMTSLQKILEEFKSILEKQITNKKEIKRKKQATYNTSSLYYF